MKRCAECSHAMESETPVQVYCIESPARVISHNGQIVSAFPQMMLWGKCDKFKTGKPQKQNEAKV